MSEYAFQRTQREAAERLAIIMAKPVPEHEHNIGDEDYFDPWDVFPVYGSYDGEFDQMAIMVLEDIQSMSHRRTDLAAYMFREMLCHIDLCDYGTSPSVCFPTQEFKALLPELIAKWRSYSLVNWGEDVTA